MNRVFIDMDGVIVDFDGYCHLTKKSPDEVKRLPGAYRAMRPIIGELEAVEAVARLWFEPWIATKPPTGGIHAYSEKAAWIEEWLPTLSSRLIVTHDKGLLGDAGDYLCDDRPHKANCRSFKGILIPFVDGYHWTQALEFLRAQRVG